MEMTKQLGSTSAHLRNARHSCNGATPNVPASRSYHKCKMVPGHCPRGAVITSGARLLGTKTDSCEPAPPPWGTWTSRGTTSVTSGTAGAQSSGTCRRNAGVAARLELQVSLQGRKAGPVAKGPRHGAAQPSLQSSSPVLQALFFARPHVLPRGGHSVGHSSQIVAVQIAGEA